MLKCVQVLLRAARPFAAPVRNRNPYGIRARVCIVPPHCDWRVLFVWISDKRRCLVKLPEQVRAYRTVWCAVPLSSTYVVAIRLCSDIPAVVARISIVLIVLGCYPLAFNAHRTNVILLLPQRWQDVLNSTPLPQKRPIDTTMSALLLPSEDHSLQASDVNDAQATPGLWKQLLQSAPHALLTALLVLISMVVGIAVPNVEVILAYKGALGGSWIIYIFPGTVWFVLLQMHRYAGRIAASAASVDEFEREKPTPTDAELRAVPVGVIWQLKDVFFAPRGILMVALVLWGLVVLFVGTITTAMGL